MDLAAARVMEPPPDPPEPLNVVREIRLAHGLSITDLSNLADISASSQTVVRTEQGTYRAIPQAIQDALLRLDTHYTPNRLNTEYAEYVKSHRNWACEQKPFSLYPWSEYQPGLHGHPFKYRRVLSDYPTLIGFCAAFCIHPSTLRRFESGTAQTVPEQVRELLFDLSYTEQDIRKLQSKHDDWLNYERASQ